MNDERLRIPQEPEYFTAIGMAVVCFARLEWNVVWCCERLDPEYIKKIEREKKTAGRIAGDFNKLVSRLADGSLQEMIAPLAQEFARIVPERNALMHAKPGTTENGDQRLFRESTDWSIAAVNLFADRCIVASSPLNALLYAELSEAGSVVLKPS